MKRNLVIIITTILLGFVLCANAEEKEIIKKFEPPTLKERLDALTKKVTRSEAELNAQIELSKEAIASAKKQLDEAKKYLDSKGKEGDAETALFKAKYYLKQVRELNEQSSSDSPLKILKLRKQIGLPGAGVLKMGDCDTDCMSMCEGMDCDLDVSPDAECTQTGGLEKYFDDGKVKVKVITK